MAISIAISIGVSVSIAISIGVSVAVPGSVAFCIDVEASRTLSIATSAHNLEKTDYLGLIAHKVRSTTTNHIRTHCQFAPKGHEAAVSLAKCHLTAMTVSGNCLFPQGFTLQKKPGPGVANYVFNDAECAKEVPMKFKHETDISTIEELDYRGSYACSTAMTARLLARIARRPGRWRRRMQSRHFRNELDELDEVA